MFSILWIFSWNAAKISLKKEVNNFALNGVLIFSNSFSLTGDFFTDYTKVGISCGGIVRVFRFNGT